MDKLSTIHDAMNDAVHERFKYGEAKKTHTYKADLADVAKAQKICKANGSNLSGYLRNCVKRLINDYQGLPTGTEE